MLSILCLLVLNNQAVLVCIQLSVLDQPLLLVDNSIGKTISVYDVACEIIGLPCVPYYHQDPASRWQRESPHQIKVIPMMTRVEQLQTQMVGAVYWSDYCI